MIKRIAFTVLIVLIYCHFAIGQMIHGHLTDSGSDKPVAFAHILIDKTQIGTVSNLEGFFELNILSQDDSITLVISAIGFKTNKVVLKNRLIKKGVQISLERDVFTLDEVEVKYQTAETILMQFQQRYKDNYYQGITISEGFYRTTFKENDVYVKLLEATVKVREDQSEKKNKLEAEITQQRKSNDYRIEKWSESGNYLFQTLNSNPVLFLSDFLNEKNLKNYSLKRLENSSYNDIPVYVISFIQKESSKKPLYAATVYINSEDYAVIKANYRFDNKDLKIGNQSYNRKIIHTSFVEGSLGYQKIGDWYVCKYLSGDTGFEIIDKETNDTLAFNLLLNEALFTNHHYEDSIVIDKPLKKWGDVYKKPFVYDPDYWNNQIKISPSTLYFEAVEDLSDQQPIEIQFFSNSANNLLDQHFDNTVYGTLDSILTVYHLTDLFNGVALVTIRDTITLMKAYGYTNLFTKKTLNTSTLFDIGSNTKQFTAAIILKLVEEGKLKLDDKIRQYLPEYIHGDKVTIHMLMGHTSGIPTFDYENQKYNDEWFLNKIEPDEFISEFCSGELGFEPGSRMEYSNSNYLLLTAIIEKITGKLYYDVLDEMIFDPLGMNNSYPPNKLPDSNVAIGYVLNNSYEHEPDWEKSNMKGVGCIYSNARDLLIWVGALNGTKLLNEQSIGLMKSPLSYYEYYNADFGYSWAINKTTFSTESTTYFYGGTSLGFYSMITTIPEKGITIILLNNTGNFPRIELSNDLINIIE